MNTWGASNKAFNNSFPGSGLNSVQSHSWAAETEQEQPQHSLMDVLLPAGVTGCCPPNCTGICSSLMLSFEQGEQPRLLWATGLSIISHCRVTILEPDLSTRGLQALAHPTHHLVSSKVHPRGCRHHHGRSGGWQVNGQMEG